MPEGNRKTVARFRPIGRYDTLEQGPNSSRSFLASESQAIDGTTQRLRDGRLGSPFVIRVAPPDLLIDALMGNGEAQTDSAFDPLLRQVFQDAEANLDATLQAFENGQATAEDVQAARQALLGGRSPAAGQNIDIIESATRAQSNFSKVVARRNAFRNTSTFVATGPTRPGLKNLSKVIGANGVAFDPAKIEGEASNQAAVSDLVQAMSVILQLNKLLDTPPLTLLVNPETLTINYAKKQQYQDRNRFNYIFQSWGEEQVRLSVSGKSAGFVVGSQGIGDLDISLDPNGGGRANVSKTSGVSGYQFASKLDSAAWQNLMSLFQFYRNNGYIYDIAGRPRSEAHLFIGTIEIAYDQWVWVGNFENFQYQYSEGKQHGAIEFSFEFVASGVFDRGCDRTGVAPVESYKNPPTPSPSMGFTTSAPVMKEPAARMGRELPMPQAAAPSTAVLDPFVDLPSANDPSPRRQTVNPFEEP